MRKKIKSEVDNIYEDFTSTTEKTVIPDFIHVISQL